MPDSTPAVFRIERDAYHRRLEEQELLAFNEKKSRKAESPSARIVPSIADADNHDSVRIAERMFDLLKIRKRASQLKAQTIGSRFEAECRDFLRHTFLELSHLRPGDWEILSLSARGKLGLAAYEQYAHLDAVARACKSDSELAALLGQDYLIAPDLVMIRKLEPDETINISTPPLIDSEVAQYASLRKTNGGKPLLHASISCKMTMRSDRAQNSRSEALNLIRTRKGRVPHIVVVTAEPLPSRLASLALGTGDMDCIYHIALHELRTAIEDVASDDSKESLRIMTQGKRLRDISDLPLDLAV